MITVEESYGSGVVTGEWLAHPRSSGRHVDPLITGDLRRDYDEAGMILDVSPRMSAVLSRRILADLLERYAGLEKFSLGERVDDFAKDTAHPSQLRENLHYLREIANFGAHTQKDDQAQIIDVSREEAEWTLDLVDRLFEYFIVGPERDRKMREGFDKKLEDAGRKPLAPPAGNEAS
ncbi:MAG: DUF4145 domain-containing protein [Gaiellaceae bacterium]